MESVLVNFLNDDKYFSSNKVCERKIKLFRRSKKTLVLLSSSPAGNIQGSDEGETDPKFFRYTEWSEEPCLESACHDWFIKFPPSYSQLTGLA